MSAITGMKLEKNCLSLCENFLCLWDLSAKAHEFDIFTADKLRKCFSFF